MAAAVDLIIVSDSDDELAKDLSNIVKSNGYTSKTLNLNEAACLFSVETHNENIVDPDVPLFIRFPSLGVLRHDYDNDFHINECFATLWAVGSLIRSPCVNRPTLYNSTGNFIVSPPLLEREIGISNPSTELYSRFAPQLEGEKKWGIQDLVTLDTALYPKLPLGNGPYKAKIINDNLEYEIVTVVGKQAWRSTDVILKQLDLEKKSIEVMERLNLQFGTIVWSITVDRNNANIARIDLQPSIDDLYYVWPYVGKALVDILLK